MKITQPKIKRIALDFVSATYAVYILILGVAAVAAVAGGELAIWELILFAPLLVVGSWFFLIRSEYQRNFFRDPVMYMRNKRRTKNAVVTADVLTGRKPDLTVSEILANEREAIRNQSSDSIADVIIAAGQDSDEDRKRRGG